jgi:hypothetical protein
LRCPIREIEPHAPDQHHDALAFPDGNTVLVNLLSEGQYARVLQLPMVGRRERCWPVSCRVEALGSDQQRTKPFVTLAASGARYIRDDKISTADGHLIEPGEHAYGSG